MATTRHGHHDGKLWTATEWRKLETNPSLDVDLDLDSRIASSLNYSMKIGFPGIKLLTTLILRAADAGMKQAVLPPVPCMA
jgi:hypothetical protein